MRLKTFGFFLVCFYPMLIQARKVVTVDMYAVTITPFFIALTIYFVAAIYKLGKTEHVRNARVLSISLFLAVMVSSSFIWEGSGSAIYFYTQYYVVEILLFFWIAKSLPADLFVRAIRVQSIISLGFVLLEIIMAGGINFSAIAARQIGLGSGSITGFFDEPALLAFGYLANIIVLMYGAERKIIPATSTFIIVVIMALVILMTLTRAAYVSLSVVFVLVLLFYVKSVFTKNKGQGVNNKWRKYFISSFLIVMLLVPLLMAKINSRHSDTYYTSSLAETLSSRVGLPFQNLPVNLVFRIDHTLAAFSIIKENPLGVGPLNSKNIQERHLIFPQFASHNSGNFITDFVVIFGVPIACIFFYMLLNPTFLPASSDKTIRLVTISMKLLILINLIFATNVLVAITPPVVTTILGSPALYLAPPIFIGPRNIDGCILVICISFIYILNKKRKECKNSP